MVEQMGKALKRFVARTVVLLVAILAAYGGWKWGDAVFPRVEARLGFGQTGAGVNTVTRETAARAEGRIEAFRDSEEAELRLGSSEVSSLLRFSRPGILPAGVLDPSVFFDQDRMEVRARVVPALIPDLPRLGGITGILPDTVQVVVESSLAPFGDEGSMLVVEAVEVQGWPVPAQTVPEILAALGQERPPGMPASAVAVPALGGLKGAYIEDGELVLVRARQSADEAARAPGAARRRAGKAVSWQES